MGELRLPPTEKQLPDEGVVQTQALFDKLKTLGILSPDDVGEPIVRRRETELVQETVVETTVAQLDKKANCFFEEQLYTTYGFSLHIPDYTLQQLHIAQGEFTSIESMQSLLSRKDVVKAVHLHGWNGGRDIWEIDAVSGVTSWTDELIHDCREKGIPVVVINIDSNGWGTSQISDDGLLLQRLGIAEYGNIQSIVKLKQTVRDLLDGLTTVEPNFRQEYLQDIESKVAEIEKLYTDAQKRAQDSYADDVKYEDDRVNDLRKQWESLRDHIAILESNARGISPELVKAKSEFQELAAALVQARDKLDRVKADIPSDWQLEAFDSFATVGKNQYDAHQRKSMPGSVFRAVNAVERLLEEVLKLRGVVFLGGHSQGGKIVDEYVERKFSGSLLIKNGDLQLIPMTFASAEAGSNLSDELPLIKLLEHLRTPAGMLMLKVGDIFRGTNTLVGGLLSMKLAMEKMPVQLKLALAKIHGRQVNFRTIITLLSQAAAWMSKNDAVDPSPNTVHAIGKQDTLIPNNPFKAWLRKRTPVSHESKKLTNAVFAVPNAESVQEYDGPHYFLFLKENQSRLIGWIANAIKEFYTMDIRIALGAHVEQALAQSEYRNVVFCLAAGEKKLPLSERLQSARVVLDAAKEASLSIPPVPVFVSQSELMQINQFMLTLDFSPKYILYNNYQEGHRPNGVFEYDVNDVLTSEISRLRQDLKEHVLQQMNARDLLRFTTVPTRAENSIIEKVVRFPFGMYMGQLQQRLLQVDHQHVDNKLISQEVVDELDKDFSRWLDSEVSDVFENEVDQFKVWRAPIAPGFKKAIIEKIQSDMSQRFSELAQSPAFRQLNLQQVDKSLVFGQMLKS